MHEGLYGVDYKVGAPTIGSNAGLAVLRDGKIIGSDCCGSVFVGSYEYDTLDAETLVRIHMTMAYDGGVITGQWAGRYSTSSNLEAALEQVVPGLEGRIDAGDPHVTFKLTYIGPLPE